MGKGEEEEEQNNQFPFGKEGSPERREEGPFHPRWPPLGMLPENPKEGEPRWEGDSGEDLGGR
jgi:hypothetical protein